VNNHAARGATNAPPTSCPADYDDGNHDGSLDQIADVDAGGDRQPHRRVRAVHPVRLQQRLTTFRSTDPIARSTAAQLAVNPAGFANDPRSNGEFSIEAD
jgi:hypothetical protein